MILSMDLPSITYEHWGLIDYQEAWDAQQHYHQSLIQSKRNDGIGPESNMPKHGKLILCAHPPVFTLGKSGKEDHLKLDSEGLNKEGFSFYKINRGGDITYHGPGQIVGYPILDLDFFYHDVHRYVREIEEVIIHTIEEWGIHGTRMKDYTGVWLPATDGKPNRKICAIGVHISRWVTLHGFALNVNTELSHFQHIIPCGINDVDKTVTSISQELGKKVDEHEVRRAIVHHFAKIFNCKIVEPC